MTKIFKMPEEARTFVAEVEQDFQAMTSGKMKEEEAVAYIKSILPLARGCNKTPDAWFWRTEEPEKLPADCRVAYVYEPTYMLTGILVYAMTHYESVKEIEGIGDVLEKVFNGCMGRGFAGSGPSALEGFVKAIQLFATADIMEFLQKYGDNYQKFQEFFYEKVNFLKEEVMTGKVIEAWGDKDYVEEATKVIEQLYGESNTVNLFVYGSLMKGQHAHHYLKDAIYLGDYRLPDFVMYDMVSYPSIQQGKGESVVGEVYQISKDLLPAIDRYEGEGSYYKREKVKVYNSEYRRSAYVYVFNNAIIGEPVREKWGSKMTDRVWYACYGSNLDEERFKCYIQGGICKENGKHYTGCKIDSSLWTDSRIRRYKGRMYFGNQSSSWEGKGVAFYDSEGGGTTIMRLYNISRQQLHEIRKQEGNSSAWYGKIECLDVEDGLPVYTLTSEEPRPENAPSERYLSLIERALVEQCGIEEDEAGWYVRG